MVLKELCLSVGNLRAKIGHRNHAFLLYFLGIHALHVIWPESIWARKSLLKTLQPSLSPDATWTVTVAVLCSGIGDVLIVRTPDTGSGRAGAKEIGA